MKQRKDRREKLKFLGRANVAGANIRRFREALVPRCSQNDLASKLQLQGLDVHKNMISKIENGEQCITDVELLYFAKVLGVTVEQLLEVPSYSKDSYDYGVLDVAQSPEE